MICQKCGTLVEIQNRSCTVCGTINNENQISSNDIAWENIDKLGILSSFFQTVYAVIFKPSTIFSAISNQSSLFKALIFAIITGTIGGLGEILLQTLYINYPNFIPNDLIPNSIVSSKQIISYAPIFTIVRVTLLSLYIHFMLLITGTKKKGITATAIGISYIQAIILLAFLSPLARNFFYLWGFFLTIYMTSRVHKITVIRASLTIMLPIIVGSILIFTILVLFLGTAILYFGPILKLLMQ